LSHPSIHGDPGGIPQSESDLTRLLLRWHRPLGPHSPTAQALCHYHCTRPIRS